MGGSSSKENEAAALAFIDRVTAENSITIFSKTYCPYCDMAKEVMNDVGVKYKVIELNKTTGELSGADIQNALATKTGRRTVPNVFLKQESIGGGTDVQALYRSGKLTEMLAAAGVLE